jgi:hypothetical protein
MQSTIVQIGIWMSRVHCGIFTFEVIAPYRAEAINLKLIFYSSAAMPVRCAGSLRLPGRFAYVFGLRPLLPQRLGVARLPAERFRKGGAIPHIRRRSRNH